MRHAAGRDDHHIGLLSQDVGGFGQYVEPEFSPKLAALGYPPIDDAHHLGDADFAP